MASFVDFLETHTPGTSECMDWANKIDSNGDNHLDTFKAVQPGLPIRWKIQVKMNTTGPPPDKPSVKKKRKNIAVPSPGIF